MIGQVANRHTSLKDRGFNIEEIYFIELEKTGYSVKKIEILSESHGKCILTPVDTKTGRFYCTTIFRKLRTQYSFENP